jgi:hypothetical protein
MDLNGIEKKLNGFDWFGLRWESKPAPTPACTTKKAARISPPTYYFKY